MMRRCLASVAALALLSGCSVVGIRSGYEQLSYTVVERIQETVEIRRYESRVAAETTVEAASVETSRNQAFRRLFDYISGANRGGSKIAMTAPVEVDAAGAKIAMTAPVETTAADDGRYTMRFFLPGGYTSASAPEPTDPTVRIVELPTTTVAVSRFTGSWDPEEVDRRQAELLSALQNSAWRAAGKPSGLFYDPPWTIPFLRRNEVVIPVMEAPESS